MQKISIVVPCYNEQEVLELFYKEVNKEVLLKIENEYEYEILFVDDGSKDKTLEILKKLKKKDDNIRIISFSRNFGKESAMYAGLQNCKRRFSCYYGCRFTTSTRKNIRNDRWYKRGI